ncbi:hypothetical protein BU17DRAFT_60741 [Hysterangium stoloniferum]|nr:hypothetical protein BU17DRAFT_60741 [Hysterangium stoloniferum]
MITYVHFVKQRNGRNDFGQKAEEKEKVGHEQCSLYFNFGANTPIRLRGVSWITNVFGFTPKLLDCALSHPFTTQCQALPSRARIHKATRASYHPSQRRHTTARRSELRSYSEDNEQQPVSTVSSLLSQSCPTGSYYSLTMARESASAFGPLGRHWHPQDEASPALSPLSPPVQPTATSSSHSTASRVGPLARHSSYMRDVSHYDVVGTAESPESSISLLSTQTPRFRTVSSFYHTTADTSGPRSYSQTSCVASVPSFVSKAPYNGTEV